ncbi:MAG: hypothetical protein PHD40_02140 [Syntrophomonadaceae bacterium]|nr:hypothetical protein [Syntrophomonadaceae bacterium]
MQDGSVYINGNIKQYLDGIGTTLPLEIISQETRQKIDRIAVCFKDFAASEYIMETSLTSEIAQVDFSLRVLTEEKECLLNGLQSSYFASMAGDDSWIRVADFIKHWSNDIEDIWLEMDYDEYDQQIPQPCFFFNASQIKSGSVIDFDLLLLSLKPLLENEQLKTIPPNIQFVMQQLPSEVGLFQVGMMLARTNDQVRIFTAELSREQTQDYLSRIGWVGSFSRLNDLFELVDQYSDGQYILDFDVSSQGVSKKIGINFGLGKNQMLLSFLENLEEHQLCTDVKKRGVMAWSGSEGCYLGPEYGFTAIIKDISHFKVSLLPEEELGVKAYLRYAGVYLKKMFAGRNLKTTQTREEEVVMASLDDREIQNIFKEIAHKSMLDKEYRELCLNDSRAAIRKVIGDDMKVPDIVFLEEEPEIITEDGYAYILPPYLKPSWLTSK